MLLREQNVPVDWLLHKSFNQLARVIGTLRPILLDNQ